MSGAPDEQMRYLLPQFIFDNGYLPNGFDASIRPEYGQHNWYYGVSYGFAPYGSSLFAVANMKLVALFTSDPGTLLIAARFSSVCFGAGTVLLCLRIGQRIFARPQMKYLLAVFCGFLPQFAFLSSYLNCDAMATFCVALIIFCWFKTKETDYSLLSCAALGLSIGLCLMSYYDAYGAIMASIIVIIYELLARQKSRINPSSPIPLRKIASRLLTIAACAFAVAGWFFIRNAILYDGDFLGLRSSNLSSEIFAEPGWKPSERDTPRSMGLSVVDMLSQPYSGMYWPSLVFKSFIAAFGYMNIFVDNGIYFCYAALIVAGIVLFILRMVMGRKGIKIPAAYLIGLLLCVAIPFVLSVYNSWSGDFQPQGRYLMPALVPFMILVTMGYEYGIQALQLRVDKRLYTREQSPYLHLSAWLTWIIALCYLCLFVAVFLTAIMPFCTQGALS